MGDCDLKCLTALPDSVMSACVLCVCVCVCVCACVLCVHVHSVLVHITHYCIFKPGARWLWLACAWFLEITLMRTLVCVCGCVCPPGYENLFM